MSYATEHAGTTVQHTHEVDQSRVNVSLALSASWNRPARTAGPLGSTSVVLLAVGFDLWQQVAS